jgi:ubiquitin-protein ligase
MIETLEERNEIALNEIKIQPIKKRIIREIKMLDTNFSSITIFVQGESGLPVLQVKDNTYKTNNIYCVSFTKDYPFRPPNVIINGKSYNNLLVTKPIFIGQLKKLWDLQCLCCNTIICYSNWSPAHTSNHIFLEIHKYRKYKKILINKLFCDKIKEKYLIEDINLDCWLF